MAGTIIVPVDLAHKDALAKAIDEAATLARARDASLTLLGVTGTGVTAVAHTPAEFAARLTAYADEVGARTGLPVAAEAVTDNDVTVDLGGVVIKAAADHGADLIVMASHVPGFMEHVFGSNAGHVANHAKCSVYVVR